VQGVNSGESIPEGADLGKLTIEASLEWTYPLSHLAIVSGDGTQVYRDRVDLTATREFDGTNLHLETSLEGRKWVRIEVWDIAHNGAFTQPVWIGTEH
jgi:hypothetical protein